MKQHIAIYFFSLLIAFTTSAYAEGSASFAVVDMQKVISKSKAAISAGKQIKSKRDKYQKQITSKEGKLRDEEKKILEQRTLVSPEAFEEKRSSFKNKVVEYQRDAQKKVSILEKSHKQALAEIHRVIKSIISEIASKKKFSIAIPKNQTLYSSNSLDITDQVLKELNSRLPDIKVKTK